MTATELRARLGEALNRASAGERVLIERDHRPLAVLVSPEDAARLDESAEERTKRRMAALDRLAAIREAMVAGSAGEDAADHVRAERDARSGDHG